jgi:hypothetical protein
MFGGNIRYLPSWLSVSRDFFFLCVFMDEKLQKDCLSDAFVNTHFNFPPPMERFNILMNMCIRFPSDFIKISSFSSEENILLWGK